MSQLSWQEQPISRHHDRRSFRCVVPALDEYLRRFARQSHTRGGAKTYVAVPADHPGRVLGYYTLAPASLVFSAVPDGVRKGLGRHEVPVYRLARLAVHLDHQGQGLGGELLFAAGVRALKVSTQVGGVALAIDAKDEVAAQWYQRFGAVRLLDDPLRLVLPLATIARALE